MSGILHKVIVARHYKINATFFLFAFILLFGLMSGQETMLLHKALMTEITGSAAYMLIALGLWALYNFKCISFTLRELGKEEHSFLYHLQGLPGRRLFLLLFNTHFSIYFPLLLYAAFTVVVGFQQGHYFLSAVFLVYQLLMCAVAAVLYMSKINSTWKHPLLKLPGYQLFKRKTYWFFLLHFSLDGRKGTFLGIKLFALLLLQLMMAANSEKLSKESICLLFMFIISAHALLPLFYVRFVEENMAFLRNLPIPLVRRLGLFVFTYALIFIPELLFLLLNVHNIMPLPTTLSLYAMAVSQMTLYTSLQYLKGMTTDRYTLFVFSIFFGSLLLLASMDLWIVAGLEAAAGIIIFASRYYLFEFIAKEED